MEAKKKLQLLRDSLVKQSLAGYIQPVGDEYANEYPPACNRRVEWLCGFSGSAGMVAALLDKAALFVDGRYTLQAKNEVSPELYEQHNSAELLPETWLAGCLSDKARIGYDPMLHTRDAIMRMQKALAQKNIELVPVANAIDAIWADRPTAPQSTVIVHDIAYAGVTSQDKRQRIAGIIKAEGADCAVLSAPDAVNWLLNIRGDDVENTPLALAMATIDTAARVQLFIPPNRCDKAVREHLGDEVELCDPATIGQRLEALGKGRRVLCDPRQAPIWFTQTLMKAGAEIVEAQDPCLLPKAMKNATELQGMRNAHVRDGAAVVKLLCWLDGKITNGHVTELEISDQLAALRALHPLCQGASFNTIAGSGPHGAIVHYRASQESNRALQKGELMLLDSGGQYPDGTTDITRTVPVGEPASEHKDRFTRVLKGHIALAMALFPEGTGGTQLDALARQYLWQAGLDYDHGTGHGVGYFLNVHEGPQRISKRGGDAALKPGMIVSNEPGYYKAGAFGIRIENLVAVVEKSKGENGKTMLGFDTITCVPIDTRLVDAALLEAREKNWLNEYHAWVQGSLHDALSAPERAWLATRCAAL